MKLPMPIARFFLQYFGTFFAIFLAFFIPVNASAQDRPEMYCKSEAGLWDLDIFHKTAQFRYSGITIDFDVADETTADPGPWPVALTLLGARDTAIAILRPQNDDFSIDLLTQRRNLPVLLVGSCTE